MSPRFTSILNYIFLVCFFQLFHLFGLTRNGHRHGEEKTDHKGEFFQMFRVVCLLRYQRSKGRGSPFHFKLIVTYVSTDSEI